MADRTDIERFEDTSSAVGTTGDVFRSEVFNALASSALRNGFDFKGMVNDAASMAFGSGAFSLTDGDDVITEGRIGEPPSVGKLVKDGLRVMKDGLAVAKDGIEVVRDGITILQDTMREAEF